MLCCTDAQALTAVALLCGGDYDEGGGAVMVGPRQAFAVVRKLVADARKVHPTDKLPTFVGANVVSAFSSPLLPANISAAVRMQAGKDDSNVLAVLAEELAKPPQLPEFGSLKGCTRCKRCGVGAHDCIRRKKLQLSPNQACAVFRVFLVSISPFIVSAADKGLRPALAGHDGQRQNKIAKHCKRNPCPDCPQSEDGACVDASPLPQPCCCRFCRTADARLLTRAN